MKDKKQKSPKIYIDNYPHVFSVDKDNSNRSQKYLTIKDNIGKLD